jgi:hypothetical protein
MINCEKDGDNYKISFIWGIPKKDVKKIKRKLKSLKIEIEPIKQPENIYRIIG